MKQVLRFGFGAVQSIAGLLNRLQAQRVFLVTGGASFETSGAAAALTPLLKSRSILRFSGFAENPRLEDAAAGISIFRSERFDAVIAVGGGSVMDMAKLVNALASQADVNGMPDLTAPVRDSGLPLIAVPTTSGSGSEATHFGVVYANRVKHSVAHVGMLPTAAVVDPALTVTLPPRLTAVTGMDALAQAIESFWCINSTAESQRYARHAIELALEHLPAAVQAPTRTARRGMSKAALLAGRAINITKTTGPHALSYPLTTHFGIPHGHAVGLTLGEFLVFNSGVDEHDVTDRRGAAFVRNAVGELGRIMGCAEPLACRQRLRDLMTAIGLQTDLASLGIACGEALRIITSNVNAERLNNNPRALDTARIERLVEAVC